MCPMRVNWLHLADIDIARCPSQESKLTLTSAGERHPVNNTNVYDADDGNIEHQFGLIPITIFCYVHIWK